MLEGRTGLSTCWRLPDAKAFRRVFKAPHRSVDRFFTVLWIANGLDHGRLGMAVAKKNLQRAVDRNLTKRLIRESFRKRRDDLIGIDVVVLSRRGIQVVDRKRLRDSLDAHWDRVARHTGAGAG